MQATNGTYAFRQHCHSTKQRAKSAGATQPPKKTRKITFKKKLQKMKIYKTEMKARKNI